MPRLINLLPCEKIIVDREGMPSLIALFHRLSVTPIKGKAGIPQNTVTFKEWAVFSEWMPDSGDVGETFTQGLELQFPDGTTSPIKAKLPFTIANSGLHRNQQNVIGFPVGQEGQYLLRLWLEKEGKPVTPVSTYPLEVSHSIPEGTNFTQVLGGDSQ